VVSSVTLFGRLVCGTYKGGRIANAAGAAGDREFLAQLKYAHPAARCRDHGQGIGMRRLDWIDDLKPVGLRWLLRCGTLP
jgi:hypothetical protein